MYKYVAGRLAHYISIAYEVRRWGQVTIFPRHLYCTDSDTIHHDTSDTGIPLNLILY